MGGIDLQKVTSNKHWLVAVMVAAMFATVLVALGTINKAGAAATPTCFGRNATIVGNNNANQINGTARSDVIVARAGADDVHGRGGGDFICGNRGNDKLEGNSGNDHINGGLGTDTLDGGTGSDVCINGEIVRDC